MKKSYFLVVPIFLALFLFFLGSCEQEDCKKSHQEIIDVDFASSMGVNKIASSLKNSVLEGASQENVDDSLSQQESFLSLMSAYEKNRFSLVKLSEREKIPLIIHQIWLGPSNLSRTYDDYRKSWQKLHPDWKYYFWTEKEVLNFDFELKSLFNKAETREEKEEILRAELLDCFGGLCVGVDFQPLASFHKLHYKYDFYAGVLPPTNAGKKVVLPLVISSELVASTPSHPIIKEWKKELIAQKQTKKFGKGQIQALPVSKVDLPFEKAVLKRLDDSQYCNIVFPSTYFYPIDSVQMLEGKVSVVKREINKFLQFLKIKRQILFSKIMPESLAVYHWSGTLRTQEERMHDVTLDLLRLQKELVKEVKELKEQLQSFEKSELSSE